MRLPLRLDIGRGVARVLCVLFAVVGVLPFGGGVLVRTESVQRWAAQQTAQLLNDLLGVTASYSVELSFWPLELALNDVKLAASDGGKPAFSARRIAVTPRIFSLIAGRLDAGDIEVDRPEARIVVRDGKLHNVRYRLPPRQGPAPKLERAPFSSLAVTDAAFDVDIDGVRALAGPVDLDVFAERGPVFEVALRSAKSTVSYRRKTRAGAEAVDDDTVCQLDVRARVDLESALVRRLSLVGAADKDPRPGTAAACAADKEDQERVAVRLSQVRVVFGDGEPTLIDGHVVARAPLYIANRFAKGPFSGSVGVVADVHYDKGDKIPDFRGKVRGEKISMDVYNFVEAFDADVVVQKNIVSVPRLKARYGKKGEVAIEGIVLEPFTDGIPLSIKSAVGQGVRFQDFMENCGVTQNTIIQWDLDKVVVTNFKGRIDPLKFDGELYSETSNFEVFDRAYHRPDRRHMIGVKKAKLRGKFGVRPDALEFMNTRAVFGKSEVFASVSVGFDNDLWLSIGKGSKIDLADGSPLVDLPMSGLATVTANMAGKASEAELKGDVSIQNLVFGGFPLGDVESAKILFKPLKVDITDALARKGSSRFKVSSARLDFDTEASLLADAVVESDRMDIRDFFHMWHFDEDPRFEPIKGKGRVLSRVHYEIGGPKDQCGTGYLRVDGSLAMDNLELYEERYDSATAQFDFSWFDQDASYLGLGLDVPSLRLTKGGGTLVGHVRVTESGVVRAHMVGAGIPLASIQAMSGLGDRLDGHASAIVEVGGTLDALEAEATGRVTPVRVGRSVLPASDFRVKLEPKPRQLVVVGKTKCGRPMPGPFDPALYAKDLVDGVFVTSGQFFGGQVRFDELRVTRQRKKSVEGKIAFNKVDLGALTELSPAVALAEGRPEGRLSATVRLTSLKMDALDQAKAEVELDELWVGQSGAKLELAEKARVTLANGRLDLPKLTLAADMPGGQRGVFDVVGSVTKLGKEAEADVTMTMRQTDLSGFKVLVPRAERLRGTLSGQLRVTGPVRNLKHRGRFLIQQGELALRGVPLTLSNFKAALVIEPDELRLEEAQASVGAGTIRAHGVVPIRGFELGESRGVVTARNIHVPLSQGMDLALDADLEAIFKDAPAAERSLPRITGEVRLQSFRYSRKVTMTADLASSLGKRGKRTEFESYDPDNDVVELDIVIRSAQPLEIENDLVEAKLQIGDQGLALGGTNQRFGMRGQVDLVKGGRIRLRRSEFEITQGHVRFDDSQRIAPKVDVTAVTEYTRYDDAVTSGDTASSSSNSGGRWRITMHAYGDAEKLRIDLSSEPKLSQDDIFLLLTLGLTRAELDQAQSASAGQSVALEALGRLTGADEAVTKNIPVIDEFRFGSAYSSRTGRTEPTVTIGKRLTQRIRAYVTSGVSESREIRSHVEWRLSPRVSVEGSYDNVNDVSSSGVGNLGADVRWRLEFE